ncbi:MAG: hypothetical protein ACRD4U_08830 [Candidatus Acidiferrales bacterium]
MTRGLGAFALALALLPLAVAQEPPPAPRPASEADVQRVVEEVNAFYRGYWKAWDERDVKTIAESLDDGFVSYLYVSGRVMQANKEASVEGVRQFVDSVRGKQTLWNRSLLTVVPRSATEVTAAVRSDFSVVDTRIGEIEVTVEVLRRGPDGRWRLARKWSERQPF